MTLPFPNLRITKELIANEITGVQPMTTLKAARQRHWEIIPLDGKWGLIRWWTYSIFTLARPKETPAYHTETTWFDTEKEAQEVMLLEKLEQ